jgi:hypothetical protein
MKIFFLTLITYCVTTFTYSQTPKVEWAKAIGGTGNERANSVETDITGNIILVGRFQSPAIKIDNITLVKNSADNVDVADIFIIKLDRNGKALWAVTAGEKGDDHATSCITDAKGNIYVVGFFESKVLKFGNVTLTKITEKGSDMYLAKFSPQGECIWAKNAGGEGDSGDYSSVTLDKDDNVIISGISGVVIDFGDGIKFNNEKSGMYVAKYRNDGQLLWAKSPVGKGEAQGVGTDKDGNVFIFPLMELQLIHILKKVVMLLLQNTHQQDKLSGQVVLAEMMEKLLLAKQTSLAMFTLQVCFSAKLFRQKTTN